LREGANPWLLQINNEGRTIEAVLKTSDPDDPGGFATEIVALRLADERRIPAPRILGLDITGSAAGTQAVLQTVVPGRSAIPVEPTPERLRVMGAAAAALHAITVEPSPALLVRTRPISASDFARERRLGTDHTTPLLAAADEQIRRLPVPAGKTGFVHGDLWQGKAPSALCSGGHERREYVVRVPVELPASAVVAHGGARVGAASSDLHVAEADASVEHGGHEGTPQHVRVHPRHSDSGGLGEVLEPVAVCRSIRARGCCAGLDRRRGRRPRGGRLGRPPAARSGRPPG
jgi:hypothetical protein